MAAAFASTAAVLGSARPGRVAGVRRCVVARASATMAAPAALAAGRTHYDVLGLGAGASRSEIKAAYRRLAREMHPDAVGGREDDGFIRLHAAYATLADPDERARYDRDATGRAAGMMMRRAARRPDRCSGGGRGRRTSAGRTHRRANAAALRRPRPAAARFAQARRCREGLADYCTPSDQEAGALYIAKRRFL